MRMAAAHLVVRATYMRDEVVRFLEGRDRLECVHTSES